MRRQLTSFSLVVFGLCLIFGSMFVTIEAPVAVAGPALAPSPRPPVVRPTSAPSNPSNPSNPSDNNGSRSRSSSGQAMGRLTGTIIDATTGAPAPGITLDINGVSVTSDANGNYDTWLPQGKYTVGLRLASEQGTDLQGPQAVEIRAEDTTIQHLYFSSPVAATEVMADPAPEAPIQPNVGNLPAPIQQLPNTSVGSDGKPSSNASVAGSTTNSPNHLPSTSVAASSGWLWFGLGGVCLVLGALVGMYGNTKSRPKRSARQRVAKRKQASNNDTFLRDLLNKDIDA
jgi:hypothetical protein